MVRIAAALLAAVLASHALADRREDLVARAARGAVARADVHALADVLIDVQAREAFQSLSDRREWGAGALGLGEALQALPHRIRGDRGAPCRG